MFKDQAAVFGSTKLMNETTNFQPQLLANNVSYQSSSLDSLGSLSETYNIQNIKQDLKELEERLHKATIFRAQLKKEKADLAYQVNFLRDLNEEIEEQTLQLQRNQTEVSKASEEAREDCCKLQDDLQPIRSQLSELIKLVHERGLVVVEHGLKMDLAPMRDFNLLQKESESLDTKVKELLERNYELRDELSRLKQELAEVKTESCDHKFDNLIENEGIQQSITTMLVEKSGSPVFV